MPVLHRFTHLLHDAEGRRYVAVMHGREADSGLWEGWIEFIPLADGTPVRSPRETTQPNRVDTLYWATGLSPTYLEGALDRALRGPIVKPIVPAARPVFEAPAPDFSEEPRRK